MTTPDPAGEERPTIRSVAARAGVSKSLVSLVLQGSPRVSPQRRDAVLAAVDALGYRPDPFARTLAERRTRTVGVVLDDLRNPWFVDVLDGVRPVLQAAGLRPLLGETRSEPDVAATFAQLRVDGLLVVGTLEDPAGVAEVARTVPTVLAGTRDDLLAPPGLHLDVVANDDEAGVRAVVGHLLGLGHRRFAHVAGAGPVGRIRRETFAAAVAAGGATGVVADADMTEDAGHRAGRRLLDVPAPGRPTAVVAVNDLSALGVLAAADELGLAVPGDVSVTGYDDTSLARLRAVSLTSVHSAPGEVGRTAAQRLLARVADPGADPAGPVLVAPRVVARGTSAPPPR